MRSLNKDIKNEHDEDVNDEKNYMFTLSETLEYLKDKGYINEFQMSDLGLKSKETNAIFKPENLTIKKVHRFEGTSDPADMSIIYQIEADDGTKGYFLDAFGTYGSYDGLEVAEFFNKVKRNNIY